jgi:hypothetical protein
MKTDIRSTVQAIKVDKPCPLCVNGVMLYGGRPAIRAEYAHQCDRCWLTVWMPETYPRLEALADAT